MQNQRRELYEFWDYKTMTERLGKDLADDLVRRHTEAEERLPQHQKGSFIIKSLVFASTFLAQTNKACATQCAQVYTHTRAHACSVPTSAPRNPDFPNQVALWRYKNFVGISEEKKRKHETQAEYRAEAEVEEGDFFDGMTLH